MSAHAVDFYDAEILVFRQFDSQGDDEELDVPNIRHLELNLELQDLLDRTSTVPLEPAIEGYLSHPAQRIGNNQDYEILFHGRWSQTTSDRKAAPYIRVDLPAIRRSHTLTGVFRLFSTDLLYVDIFLRYRPEKQQTASQTSELRRERYPTILFHQRTAPGEVSRSAFHRPPENRSLTYRLASEVT